MSYMVLSHHISSELITERQREMHHSVSRGWRLAWPFGRRAAELEHVPPARIPAAAGGARDAAETVARPSAGRAELRVRPMRHAARAAARGRAHARSREQRERERAGV
jgi:hypothetical protein